MNIEEAVSYIRNVSDLVPELCLVLGSGFGEIANEIVGARIPYTEIPGFPRSTAPSHGGVLHVGTYCGRSIVAMQGRVHLYEGYSAAEVVFPIRVMHALGASTAVLTNAAGALGGNHRIGDLVLIEDHVSLANLAGLDPLRGFALSPTLPRFVSLNRAYDPALLRTAETAAHRIGEALTRGIYAFVTGPSFETPAEIRMLESFGCDLVGMSTVPEVLAARHIGMRVLAISAVSNAAVNSADDGHLTSAEEVWEAMERIRPTATAVLKAIVQAIDVPPDA